MKFLIRPYYSYLAAGLLSLSSSIAFANTADVTIEAASKFTVASSPLAGKEGCRVDSGDHPYGSVTFTVPATGAYSLSTTGSTVEDNDTFIALYSPSFNASAPTEGLIACNDDSNAMASIADMYLSKIDNTNLDSGTQYELVVTYKAIDGIGGIGLSFSPNVTIEGAKTTQTITFAELSSKTFGDADVTLTATASSELPVNFALASTSTGCSLNESVVNITGAGTCVIEASQAGDDKFEAAETVSQSFTIAKAAQTIEFVGLPTNALVGNTWNLDSFIIKGASGLPVIFDTTTSSVCTINATEVGTELTFIDAGTCTLTADQAGDNQYEAAQQISADIFTKKNQVLTLVSPDVGVEGKTGTLSAISDSGLTDIQFTVSPADICVADGTTLTYKTQGLCEITMKQAGNAQVNPAEETVKIDVVSKGVFSIAVKDKNGIPTEYITEGEMLNIDITFLANRTDIGKAADFYLKTTAGSTAYMLTSNGLVSATDPLQPLISQYTLSTEQATMPLYSGTLPPVKYTVYAAYKTSTNTEEAIANITVKAKQDIVIDGFPDDATVGAQATLTLTGGGSTNPVKLSSTNTKVCTIADKTVIFLTEGECTLEATQAGNETFADAYAIAKGKVSSAGVFTLKVTKPDSSGGGTFLYPITENCAVKIGLEMKASTVDVGKKVDIYLMAETGSNKLMLNSSKTWVAAITPLQAAATQQLSGDSITLPLYEGKLPVGSYTLNAAYKTSSGKTVNASSSLTIGSESGTKSSHRSTRQTSSSPPNGPCVAGQQHWVQSGAPYCRRQGRNQQTCTNFDHYTCRRGKWTGLNTVKSCRTCSRGTECVAGIPVCLPPNTSLPPALQTCQ